MNGKRPYDELSSSNNHKSFTVTKGENRRVLFFLIEFDSSSPDTIISIVFCIYRNDLQIQDIERWNCREF